MMGIFKVGDKVRLKEKYGNWDAGTEGVIDSVLDDYNDEDDLIYTDTVSGVYARRLELVPAWAPKVGDRVVEVKNCSVDIAAHWNKHFRATMGDIIDGALVVASISNHLIGLSNKVGRNFFFMNIDDLQPAPAATKNTTLTIEAGKFYKTRDDRKVGPMEDCGGAPGEDLSLAQVGGFGKLFNRDGTHHYKDWNIDLIAEWVDEPAVANDNGAPAKFKVGDRVRVTTRRFGARQFGKTGVIVDDKYDDKKLTIEIKYDTPLDHGLSINQYSEADLERVVPWATPATTPAIVALIEDGVAKPATRPVVHASQEAATTEASRLALLYPGQEFGVFVLAGSKIADVVEEVVKKTVLRAA